MCENNRNNSREPRKCLVWNGPNSTCVYFCLEEVRIRLSCVPIARKPTKRFSCVTDLKESRRRCDADLRSLAFSDNTPAGVIHCKRQRYVTRSVNESQVTFATALSTPASCASFRISLFSRWRAQIPLIAALLIGHVITIGITMILIIWNALEARSKYSSQSVSSYQGYLSVLTLQQPIVNNDATSRLLGHFWPVLEILLYVL